jgi:hypothetical protein
VHHAIDAVTSVVIAAAAVDGTVISVDADQVGFVLDERGSFVESWVGRLTRPTVDRRAAYVGLTAARLLMPVAETARRAGRIWARGMSPHVLGRLKAHARQLEREGANALGDGWIDEMLCATGHVGPASRARTPMPKLPAARTA